MLVLLLFLYFIGFFPTLYAIGDDDLIQVLPNVTFNVKFKQYSGYLNASLDGKLKFFYWYVRIFRSRVIKT
jgi:hypothetical protein